MVKIGWLAVLAGALLFLVADSSSQLRSFRAVTAIGAAGRPAPAPDPGSPTGYQNGRRSQILQSTDGYHWVMQTQQMIATGDWRVRRVDYDNAPDGREVHWCSPLHWWLAAVAWADHAVTGRSWLVAVEHAALYAGPLLLGLFLLAVVPWTARRFGAWPAALLAAGLVAIVPFSGEYGTGSFDHHGVVASCALLTVLFLAAGWNAPPEQARRAFIASGIAGAAGLWVNAASQIPVLAGIGVGVLLADRLAHGEKSPPIDPRLWRTWGLAGGAASLLFYLVEYFPAHLGWRLEVNHPLYALAWAGAGDLLARWGERRLSPAAIGSALAVALPPLLMLLAPERTFVVADRFLWTLHVDYISEFAPLSDRLHGWESLLVQINVLPLVGLFAVWLLWRGGLAPVHRALLALSLPPAALISLLALSQQRWLHLSCALWLAVLVIAAMVTTGSASFPWNRPRRILAVLFLGAVLLPYPVRAGLDAFRGPPAGLSVENIRQFAMRDLAFWLRRRTGTGPVVVLSGPTATTELVYHGGLKGVGTLYWENLAGLRALVDIYGATDQARARELLLAHRVTHLVLMPWGTFAPESARLARGLRATNPVPAGSFALDLLAAGHGLPDWVRPLPYRLPESEQLRNQFALVLEIAPTQSPADAAVRRAQFLAALGDPPAALELTRQVLAENPAHIPALITLAQLQRAARDRPAHGATIQRLLPLLATDPALEPGDRVALALELAAASARDATRAQVERCWASFGKRDVRRLSPESLAVLLRLTRDFAVVARPELLAVAESVSAADRPSRP